MDARVRGLAVVADIPGQSLSSIIASLNYFKASFFVCIVGYANICCDY